MAKDATPATVIRSIVIPRDDAARLAALARESDRSFAAEARRAIRRYVAAQTNRERT